MHEKCVHELIKSPHPMENEFDPELDLDLNTDLDDYLLHPQPQATIRIVHAFMGDDRAIEHVCEEMVCIEDGVLRQEQLIWCIKRQQQQQRALSHAHFKLRAMFLYNMDLEAEEVPDFLKYKPPVNPSNPSNPSFITPISAVEDVAIQPTIPMFASLNALHIMYQCGNHPHLTHNQSKKRVVIHSNSKTRTRGPDKHTRKTA
jgi:hypothetical protein